MISFPNIHFLSKLLVYKLIEYEYSLEIIFLCSTDAVFPNGGENCEEDADISTFSDRLTDGYSQSKWVAEQIITSARKRGIPAAIYRLGNATKIVLSFRHQGM